jgi:hypothetical protein
MNQEKFMFLHFEETIIISETTVIDPFAPKFRDSNFAQTIEQ